ncbi:MAG: DUF1294 domain-containing protein [Chitinophagales bacterium]
MMLANTPIIYLVAFLALLNGRMTWLMFKDKRIATGKTPIRGKDAYDMQRIPEIALLYNAIFFGSLGGLLGMFLFRHKTRKPYFLSGFLVLLVFHTAFLFLLLDYLNK